jgi:pyruvate,water dikinase
MQNHPGEILWTAGFFNERFPAPISPLGWSLLGPLIEEIALREPLRYLGYPDAEKIPLTRLWHGHPYANVLAFQILYKVFPDWILPEDVYRYFPDGDANIRKRAPYPRSLCSPRFLLSMLRGFLSDPLNFSPLHNYRRWARYTHEHDRRVIALRARMGEHTEGEHTAGDHTGSPLRDVSARAIFAALREAEDVHRDLLRIHRWSLMHADLTFGVLKRLTRAWVDCDHADEIVARAVAGAPNKTLEVDAALRELADSKFEIQNSKWRVFLAEHGHRSFSLDIAVPTFAEEPMQVVRLLATAADRPPTAAVGAALCGCPSAVGGLRSLVFDTVLRLARRYVALRENQRYYWQKSLAVSRHLYLLLADRLLLDGVIASRDQVFYATHQELADYFEARLARDALAASIAARQAEWRGYVHEFEQSPTASYPAFLRGDVPLSPRSPQQQTWRGRAVSPGSARGAARVVRSADDLGRVRSGEILIAPSTDPAWTPVFGRIAGLVLERGGVLSHGAVVAREYRIPAVAGIANIVDAIRDGEMIEVDGSAGVVTRVSGSYCFDISGGGD